MPKQPKRPRDPNELAKHIVDIATGAAEEPESAPDTPAQKFARSGGLKGGKARAEALSPEQRRDMARQAATRLWLKRTKG